MAPTCTHERSPRSCPWCREAHSLALGFPIEVAQLAHRRRWDDDPHTVASLSADARRAYAKAAGRVGRSKVSSWVESSGASPWLWGLSRWAGFESLRSEAPVGLVRWADAFAREHPDERLALIREFEYLVILGRR